MFNRLECEGVSIGKLLDNKFFLYELKIKRPPIRLYFYISDKTINIIAYGMKTSKKKQQQLIDKIKKKMLNSYFFSCIKFPFFNVFHMFKNFFI